MTLQDTLNYRFASVKDQSGYGRVIAHHQNAMPAYSLYWMNNGEFFEMEKSQVVAEFGLDAQILTNGLVVTHKEWINECD